MEVEDLGHRIEVLAQQAVALVNADQNVQALDTFHQALDLLETVPSRSARKQVEGMGIGTKAQQAMSAGYEARKDERKAATRQAKQEESERRFALKQQKRKQKHRGR